MLSSERDWLLKLLAEHPDVPCGTGGRTGGAWDQGQLLRGLAVCTENSIRVDDVMESPKLAE